MPQQLTSIAAQPSLFTKQNQRMRILDVLRASSDGLTDSEIQARLDLDGSTERPRRGELLTEGLIRDSLRRRANLGGRFCIVWEVVP